MEPRERSENHEFNEIKKIVDIEKEESLYEMSHPEECEVTEQSDQAKLHTYTNSGMETINDDNEADTNERNKSEELYELKDIDIVTELVDENPEKFNLTNTEIMKKENALENVDLSQTEEYQSNIAQ